jgi:hypothetical protein
LITGEKKSMSKQQQKSDGIDSVAQDEFFSPPIIIGGGSNQGDSPGTAGDEGVVPQGSGLSEGTAEGEGASQESGVVTQGSGQAQGQAASVQDPDPNATPSRQPSAPAIRVSATSTGLAESAGVPATTGRIVLAENKKRKSSLVATAAFEALGKDATETGVRGKTLPEKAKARTEPTIGGVLTTEAGGARAIRGSPELFERLKANLNSKTDPDGNGGSVISNVQGPSVITVPDDVPITIDQFAAFADSGRDTVPSEVSAASKVVIAPTRGQKRFGRR